LKTLETKIVGIVLVQNEEFYIGRVLWNIKDFCDRIIIADHRSIDSTTKIAQHFCAEHTGAEYHTISHPSISHDLIKPFAGKNVWVFGVDGDELYDPEGLAELRRRILNGDHDHWWMILGNALNCTYLNVEKRKASGYLAPPCRSMTKLYNFNAIEKWDGPCPERLHGGSIKFKKEFNLEMRFYLYKVTRWEDSVFRCLHLCFLPRSSGEKPQEGQLSVRKNIADQNSETILQKILFYVRRTLGVQEISPLKIGKYMRGTLVHIDIDPFLP